MGVALDSVRECSRCGDVKQLVAFANYKGRDGEKHRGGVCKICRENMASKDQEAMRAWRKGYNEKNRSKKALKDSARRAEAKAFVDAYKTRPCADCGRVFPPVAMDFDHIHGAKIRNVASLVGGAYRLDLIKSEIEKCDVVCACCHRIRTWTRGEHNAPSITEVPRIRTVSRAQGTIPVSLRVVVPTCPNCGSDFPRKYGIGGICEKKSSCLTRRTDRRMREDRLRGVPSSCDATPGPGSKLRCVLTSGHDGLHIRCGREWGTRDHVVVDTGKRPVTEREWVLLRALVRAAPKWLRTRDFGGSNNSWHHEVLRKFVRLGWAERRERSVTVQRGSYVYTATEIGRSLVLEESVPSSWREAYEVVCREAKSV